MQAAATKRCHSDADHAQYRWSLVYINVSAGYSRVYSFSNGFGKLEFTTNSLTSPTVDLHRQGGNTRLCWWQPPQLKSQTRAWCYRCSAFDDLHIVPGWRAITSRVSFGYSISLWTPWIVEESYVLLGDCKSGWWFRVWDELRRCYTVMVTHAFVSVL